METKIVLQLAKHELEPILCKTGNRRFLFENVIKECIEKYNGYFHIVLGTPKKQRTLKENAKYWAMCSEYGVFAGGLTKEEVHEGVKDRASAERGYPKEWNPISKRDKPMSSAKATTIEFKILIDTLYQIAAEEGYIFKGE